MYQDLFIRLERAIQKRDSELAARLRPGLPEPRARRLLERGKVKGLVDPIVRLFSWKDGAMGRIGLTLEEMSVLPFAPFAFPCLAMMINEFHGFEEGAADHPRYKEVVGRYFPLFAWRADAIAVDLDLKSCNRVAVLEHNSDKLVRIAYASFEEFLTDAIRANEENVPLKCFAGKIPA